MSELKTCPFCGGEAKFVHIFENPEKCMVSCRECDGGIDAVFANEEAAAEAWNRRAQPANEPLTLEQLWEMEQHGEGIYVTHADGSSIFRGKQYTAAVLDRIAAFGAMGYHLQAIYGRGLTLAEDDYGKTWLAYRTKPERSENGG